MRAHNSSSISHGLAAVFLISTASPPRPVSTRTDTPSFLEVQKPPFVRSHYLACVIDIRSRRMLGYSMAPHMQAGPVIDALQGAVAARGGDVTGVIFHADHGSPYTSAAFAQVCDRYGVRRSMGRAGSSHDNALAERSWQGLKRETMHGKLFSTVRQARLEIFGWLTCCNARRRHSALGCLSPIEFEQQHHRTAKPSLAA
ncbi:transposase [Streptomyces altiplanensis]